MKAFAMEHGITLAFFGTIGVPEMIIIGVLGVLLFGRRLPEVGKSVGRSIVEFKKGLAGIEDEVDNAGKDNSRIESSKSETVDAEKKSESTQQA